MNQQTNPFSDQTPNPKSEMKQVKQGLKNTSIFKFLALTAVLIILFILLRKPISDRINPSELPATGTQTQAQEETEENKTITERITESIIGKTVTYTPIIQVAGDVYYAKSDKDKWVDVIGDTMTGDLSLSNADILIDENNIVTSNAILSSTELDVLDDGISFDEITGESNFLPLGGSINLLGDVYTSSVTYGQYLRWNGSTWAPDFIASGQGSVTQIDTGNGLTGGPITTSGTISVNSSTCSGTDKLQWNGTTFICSTDNNTTYTAGNDLNLSGTTFNIETQLDYVSVISRASNDLTLQTTTSGNIILNPAGNVGINNTSPQRSLYVNGDMSIGNNLLTQLDGGLYFGRVEIAEKQWQPISYGNTWTAKDNSRQWRSVAMSSSGEFMLASVSSGTLYISSDYGQTWTSKDSSRNWDEVAMSLDGKYQTAVNNLGYIYTSDDYGNTWTQRGTQTSGWWGVAMSADGKFQSATRSSSYIYTSDDYGVTWAQSSSPSLNNWRDIDVSSDGRIQTAVHYGGYIYVSTDYGSTWTTKGSSLDYMSVAISSNGQYQTAVVYGGNIYISDDYGQTWSSTGSSGNWDGIDVSANGKVQTAVQYASGHIYVSSDYGASWASKGSALNYTDVSISSDGRVQAATVTTSNIYLSYADVYTIGNVGIGTSSPAQDLEVNGDIRLDANGSATTNGLCHSGANSDTTFADRDIVACSGAPADVAEWYDTKNGEPGDIVSTTDETVTYTSPAVNALTGEVLNEKETLTASVLAKTNYPYQSNVLGIISTSPYETFGRGIIDYAQNPNPIALTGRVLVKVSTQNGEIQPGDPITTSTIPGVGMKATNPGVIIGRALDYYSNINKVGKILVFVNISWYESNDFRDELIELLEAYKQGVIGSLDTKNSIESSTLTQSIPNITVENIHITQNLQVDGVLTSREIQTDLLSAKSNQDIIVRLSEQIGSTALIIENSLGQSVFSVDSTGKLSIISDTNTSSVGSAQIPAGQIEIIIQTSAVTPTSKIFITPRSNIGDTPLYVDEATSGSFKVKIAHAKSTAITFDWWIIN